MGTSLIDVDESVMSLFQSNNTVQDLLDSSVFINDRLRHFFSKRMKTGSLSVPTLTLRLPTVPDGRGFFTELNFRLVTVFPSVHLRTSLLEGSFSRLCFYSYALVPATQVSKVFSRNSG